jgi:anti-sigma factor (TIGR02949 family)
MLFNLYTCKEALQRLDDYIDHELTPQERKHVQLHLKLCRKCAQKFAFEASVVAEVRAKLRRIEVPAGLKANLSEMWRELSEEKTPDG